MEVTAARTLGTDLLEAIGDRDIQRLTDLCAPTLRVWSPHHGWTGPGDPVAALEALGGEFGGKAVVVEETVATDDMVVVEAGIGARSDKGGIPITMVVRIADDRAEEIRVYVDPLDLGVTGAV